MLVDAAADDDLARTGHCSVCSIVDDITGSEKQAAAAAAGERKRSKEGPEKLKVESNLVS